MKTSRILTTTIALLLTAATLHAQTWDGGGANDNLITAANWNPDGIPGTTADVIFGGAVRLAPNVSGSFQVNSLTFNNTAGAFVFGGVATLSIKAGGLVSNDTTLQTFNNPVSFGLAATSTINAASGALTLNGAVTLATTTLTLDGANAITFGSTITGSGAITKIGAGAFTFGGTATVIAADFNLNGGTTTLAATGVTQTFSGTSTIAVGNATLNLTENITLDGGQLMRNAGGTLTLAPNTTLTVQAGGDAIITGFINQANRANLTVTGAGSTFTTTGDFQWEGGNSTLSFLNISGGGLISSGGALHLARTNSAVSMTVNGEGSQVIASPFFTSEWQAGVLLVNGASATLGGLRIADAIFAGSSSASLNVQSGSTVSLGNLAIATVAATANGSLTVDGPGSVVTQTGSSTLGLGAAFATTATMSVNNGGAFTGGTGTFTLNATGVVNLGGGTATFNGLLADNGGTVNFTSGALIFNNPGVNLTVGNGGLLGENLTLTSDKRLLIGGTTTLEPFRTLALNGGTFTTSALVNNGTLAFTSGTLAITGAGGFNIGTGALGSNVTLGTGANLQVTNAATIASGATLTVNGGSVVAGTLNNSGTLRANLGTVSAASGTNTSGGRIFIGDTLDVSGSLTNASGGRITLEGGSGLLSGAGSLSNSGVVTGDGTITKPLVNLGTGEVRGELGRTLNFTNGGSNIGQFNLLGGTLDFSTSALTNHPTGFISGHGALFTGSLANGGQIAFSGGHTDLRGDVTNSADGRIVTSGGATTTFFDDVVHNGTEIRTSAGGASVFFGAVSGAGPYTGTGTVYFEGDLRPGNSPASVLYEGYLVFGGGSTLTLELGGLALGGQYDHLNVGGTITAAGALDVVLYGGFAPHFGDMFDLFDAGNIAGAFDAVNLPALSGDLTWDDSQLSTSGTLRVVPEPGVTTLFLFGLCLPFCRRRRTNR